MSHSTLAQAAYPGVDELRETRRLLGVHWITHDAVAAEASKTSRRGHVGRTLVSHVFADPPRAKSLNVVGAARRLIAEAERRLARARARKRQDGDGA